MEAMQKHKDNLCNFLNFLDFETTYSNNFVKWW